MDNKNNQSGSPVLLQPHQFPAGIIRPRMLAASRTVAEGDLYYSDGNTRFLRLPIGTSGQRLVVSNGVPIWSTESGASGTFTTADAKTVTVVRGIITSIV